MLFKIYTFKLGFYSSKSLPSIFLTLGIPIHIVTTHSLFSKLFTLYIFLLSHSCCSKIAAELSINFSQQLHFLKKKKKKKTKNMLAQGKTSRDCQCFQKLHYITNRGRKLGLKKIKALAKQSLWQEYFC